VPAGETIRKGRILATEGQAGAPAALARKTPTQGGKKGGKGPPFASVKELLRRKGGGGIFVICREKKARVSQSPILGEGREGVPIWARKGDESFPYSN